MRFRYYYILGLLATLTFSLQLNNKPDSFDLSNGRSLEDGWEVSEEMWVIPNQACSCFVIRVTESDLRSVTLLLKRVIGGLGLNTACWKAGRTYTMVPIPGLIVSIFLQPGGSTSTLGNTVSWAAENALNVAIRVLITFVLPNNDGSSTVRLDVNPGTITPTNNWKFPAGSTNFQLAARSLDQWLGERSEAGLTWNRSKYSCFIRISILRPEDTRNKDFLAIFFGYGDQR